MKYQINVMVSPVMAVGMLLADHVARGHVMVSHSLPGERLAAVRAALDGDRESACMPTSHGPSNDLAARRLIADVRTGIEARIFTTRRAGGEAIAELLRNPAASAGDVAAHPAIVAAAAAAAN